MLHSGINYTQHTAFYYVKLESFRGQKHYGAVSLTPFSQRLSWQPLRWKGAETKGSVEVPSDIRLCSGSVSTGPS